MFVLQGSGLRWSWYAAQVLTSLIGFKRNRQMGGTGKDLEEQHTCFSVETQRWAI
jgi:hypothetical protein